MDLLPAGFGNPIPPPPSHKGLYEVPSTGGGRGGGRRPKVYFTKAEVFLENTSQMAQNLKGILRPGGTCACLFSGRCLFKVFLCKHFISQPFCKTLKSNQ